MVESASSDSKKSEKTEDVGGVCWNDVFPIRPWVLLVRDVIMFGLHMVSSKLHWKKTVIYRVLLVVFVQWPL